jgi:hypothetical protein
MISSQAVRRRERKERERRRSELPPLDPIFVVIL